MGVGAVPVMFNKEDASSFSVGDFGELGRIGAGGCS